MMKLSSWLYSDGQSQVRRVVTKITSVSNAEVNDRRGFLGTKEAIECTHKLNRNKGQLSKASHNLVTAKGGLFPLGRMVSVQTNSVFNFKSARGRADKLTGLIAAVNMFSFPWLVRQI
jgi:hypothetical protein